MSYRPHGRATVNANSPKAFARCDRCGFIYNHSQLQFQFDYRGPQLQNLRFLVCEPCLDKPQPQLKPLILTEDPLPVINARPEDYNYANTGYLAAPYTTQTDVGTGIPIPESDDLITEGGDNLTTQPYGKPLGLDPNAIMPLSSTTAYDVVLPILSVTSNGTTIITVTCSQVHNLSTNAQVAIEGLSNSAACGFFSIVVTTATAFTYTVSSPIISGSLITGTSRIVTANVGLPNGYVQIPLVGN